MSNTKKNNIYLGGAWKLVMKFRKNVLSQQGSEELLWASRFGKVCFKPYPSNTKYDNGKSTMNEDVFPIGHGEFHPYHSLVFQGVSVVSKEGLTYPTYPSVSIHLWSALPVESLQNKPTVHSDMQGLVQTSWKFNLTNSCVVLWSKYTSNTPQFVSLYIHRKTFLQHIFCRVWLASKLADLTGMRCQIVEALIMALPCVQHVRFFFGHWGPAGRVGLGLKKCAFQLWVFLGTL